MDISDEERKLINEVNSHHRQGLSYRGIAIKLNILKSSANRPGRRWLGMFAHDPWRALKRLDRPVRVLKAETGSPCHLSDHVRSLPRLKVETVPGGTHFFPMLQADIARDALFDAAV